MFVKLNAKDLPFTRLSPDVVQRTLVLGSTLWLVWEPPPLLLPFRVRRSEPSFPMTGSEEPCSTEPHSPLLNSVTRQTYLTAAPSDQETYVVIQENNSRGARFKKRRYR